jgi:hypothetical protein
LQYFRICGVVSCTESQYNCNENNLADHCAGIAKQSKKRKAYQAKEPKRAREPIYAELFLNIFLIDTNFLGHI